MARKQQEIPGTEAPSIAEIDDAGEEYRLVRDERMRLSTKESEAKKKLIAAMQNHGQTTYKYVDQDGNERVVRLEQKFNAKVAKPRSSASSDDGDGENVSVQ